MKEGRWAGRDDQEGLPDGAKLDLQEEEHTESPEVEVGWAICF